MPPLNWYWAVLPLTAIAVIFAAHARSGGLLVASVTLLLFDLLLAIVVTAGDMGYRL